MDPRLPVIVGVGEIVRRPGDVGPTDPGELAAAAVREALADAGAGDAPLGRAGAVGGLTSVAWGDGDPGRRVCELLGVEARTIRASMFGGNGPQVIVNVFAERIQLGSLDAGLVCGAEALHTVTELRRRGETVQWALPDPARRADEVLEEDRLAGTEAEGAVGMIAPITAYPLIENAIRVAAGRTQAEHLRLIGELWSRFSEVAASSPAAWSHRVYEAEELITPSASNRQVTLPYTKLLNSHLQVDQGAALLIVSAALAEQLGVPKERWVFVHAGARATDEWFLSERRELHRSPAIRACGEAVLGHAGLPAAELGPVDLYSCFPAAVELAAGELGLPLDDPGRPLTCTGGLTFFGGPGNNYATHGIAAVVRALRAAGPGTVGLASALGWYATKHAIGLYGNEPPAKAFAALEPRPEQPEPRRVAEPGEADGAEATAETCTVVYERDGAPSFGILFALLDDGRRALCRTDDAATMRAMGEEGFLGSRVHLRTERSFAV